MASTWQESSRVQTLIGEYVTIDAPYSVENGLREGAVLSRLPYSLIQFW
jgi:hypothetical protein